MNLAQVIHQRWAAAEALNDLLPAARVYTGLSVDLTMPFAVISKQSDRPVSRCNDGSAVDTIGVRIQVFHDDYDSAAATVQQVKAVFDQSSFALAGGDRVITMQRADDSEQQEEDGVWRMVIDFNCTVYLADGV
jgi:hypothetical protein